MGELPQKSPKRKLEGGPSQVLPVQFVDSIPAISDDSLEIPRGVRYHFQRRHFHQNFALAQMNAQINWINAQMPSRSSYRSANDQLSLPPVLGLPVAHGKPGASCIT